MIYTKETKKAFNLMYNAHKDQKDKGGAPYCMHPIHLAEQMETEDECVAALLHDVVEDTEYTFLDLKIIGFNDRVIDALKLLTHDKSVPYEDYIKEVAKNPIARHVKMKDLEHNLQLARVEKIREKDLDRSAKYIDSLLYLKEIDIMENSNNKGISNLQLGDIRKIRKIYSDMRKEYNKKTGSYHYNIIPADKEEFVYRKTK